MSLKGPTASAIRAANRKAVGGGKKRCKKGKACSATCIAANEDCLVGLPEPVSQSTTKVVAMIQQRKGGAGATAQPAATQPTLADLSARNLTADQDEKVDAAARMTNYRIEKRLNDRQFYDDATNAKIKAANQKVVAPFQRMNENEKAALSLYGQDGVKYYQQVNQMLRSGQIDDSTPDKVKMAEFISGNLRSGLEKLPPAKVEELGRAVTGNFATSLANLKLGDVIEDKGFGSYTDKGTPVYNQFFKKDQPNAAIRILNPKSAREVAPVMEYSREGEHISMPGTRLRLVGVQEQGVYSRKTGGYIPQYTFEEVSE